MAYETGSNVWPTGAVTVGKHYGEQDTGGSSGVLKTYGYEKEVEYRITSTTADLPLENTILGDYLIVGLTLNVKTAFDATSTADISIDGGAGLTTELDLATAGLTEPATTGLANTNGSGPVVIKVTADAAAIGSDAGEATLVVKYKNVA